MLSNARSRLLRTLAPAAAVAAILCAPSAAHSQTCSFDPDRFPASPPPASLWNGLEPAYTVLPSSQTGGPSRDSSWYETNGNFGLHNPLWWAIDDEGGYLYAAVSQGYQVWHIGSNATEPPRLANKSIHTLAPVLHDNAHDFHIPRDIDAAPGDHTLVAMTGDASMGMLLIDAREAGNKNNPRVFYQDHGPNPQSGPEKDGQEVYVGSIGGRYYGFLATNSSSVGPSSGVWVYDLTKARELGATTPCVEQLPNVVNCPGVGKGRLTTKQTYFVHGTADGSKHYVVFAGGHTFHKGFEIWDVTNPSAPVRKLAGLSADVVQGVALWRDAAQNKIFLALANRKNLVTGARGQIYDVTCVRTSCGSPGTPLYDFPLTGHAGAGLESPVTFSRTGGATGTPYVYFGRALSTNSTVLQSEWLLDVTTPSQPVEVTGGDPLNGGAGQPTIVLGGMTLGYWGYYSHCAPDGTNYYRAEDGRVTGNYFYRAGYSILDIHELVAVDPRITVAGPTTGYTGQTLSYTASGSGGCSPAAGQWSWILGGTGGQVIGPQTGSSVNVQWSNAGQKTIRAENSACPGADSVALAVQITNAAPSIGSVTAAPTTAPVCTQVTFNATATGQPPLSYNWTIEQGGNPVPGEGGTGNPFVWDTEGISPGTYQGRATVSGPGGSATGLSPAVTLTALPTLPGTGQFTISHDPPDLGEVQFHSNVPGATQWRWDFDDGTILETQDPALGQNPVHVYTETGTYDVRLQVRNCVETDYRTSAALNPLLTITEVQVIDIVDFRANCPFGLCAFVTGTPISFFHNVIGEPSTYMYDWAGDGVFEQSSPTPVTSHTYSQPGTYTPVLKVSLGSQTDTFTAPQFTVTQGGPPPTPSISIGGPGSLLVGQQGSFSASALNCTPSPSGWTWTASGGGTGSSTSNSINLSWTSSGNKTITAKNSACGNATGTKFVNVSTPGGGDPTLEASFTFSPPSPSAGQTVSFDASASIGDIIDWSWSFGDGSLGSGETTTHVYSQPGSYTVTLSVAELGSGPGCQQGICFDATTKTIVVGGGGPGGGDCVRDANTLCLMNGRFQIRARFLHPQNGIQPAKVYEPFAADRTGMFWFFRPDNVELITKSLDGTNPDLFPNPAYWFFYGGLSNVEYWIEVTDTAIDPPRTVEYHNLPGVICGQADTGAFPTEDVPVPAQGGALAGAPIRGAGVFEVEDRPGVITAGGSSGTCVPSLQRLCLLEGRFAVEVDWHDQHNNEDGVGQAIAGTDRTGYFWFFRDDNIELVAKMIDPRPHFEHFWILWGGLSDVEYKIKVTDTVTQTTREYTNPPGSFCGGADTTAFPAE